MEKRINLQMWLIGWIFLAGPSVIKAQQTPDVILYNGKIITMDNHEVNEHVGTIAQALAVKGDLIVAVGINSQMRALAGPNTKSIDLRGRTVIPGWELRTTIPTIGTS